MCDRELIELAMLSKSPKSKTLYQVHSPPFEGPQFVYEILNEFHFDWVGVIAQGHGRFLDEAVKVPNIISDFKPIVEIERSDVLFSPHMRVTSNRWSNKVSEDDMSIISSQPFVKVKNIEDCFGRENVTQNEVRLFLNSVKYVVDDINTGQIHQTAFEGLKSNCITFSNADLWTLQEASEALQAPPLPIDYVNNAEEILELLLRYRSDTEYVKRIKLINEYSHEYLSEERLARIYYNKIKSYL